MPPTRTHEAPADNGAARLPIRPPSESTPSLAELAASAAALERKRIAEEAREPTLEALLGLLVQSQRNLALARSSLFTLAQKAQMREE